MLTRLKAVVVEKPWGRTNIPSEFGHFGGRRIGEIWFAHPAGDASPVLVKFLFTSERLSVQVHPDDAAARAAGYQRGKDECWLVLSAEPNAELGVGIKRKVSVDELRQAAIDGSIVELIDWRQTAADDFIYNAAGTIHAIGAGLTLVEVQQNIDCTYRLFDYGRSRPLHLADGLRVATPGPVRDRRDAVVDRCATGMLVKGPHFQLAHLAGPIDPTIAENAVGEATLVPLSSGCSVAGESVKLGEAVLLSNPSEIELNSGSRALLTWTA